MTFQEYLGNRLASRVLMNYEDLVSGLDDSRVKRLASSRYKRDSLLASNKTQEEYIAEVLTRIKKGDILTCTSYVKRPLQQNEAELAQFDFIRENLDGFDMEFTKLSTTGYSIDDDGDIVNGSCPSTHTIDFQLSGSYLYYVYAKYTSCYNETQMDDLLHFAERAQHNRERSVKFVFLLDGSFYSKKTRTHSRYYGESRLEYFKHRYTSRKFIIGTSDDVVKKIERLESRKFDFLL